MTAVEVPSSIPTPPVRAALFRSLVRRPLPLAAMLFLAIVLVIAVIGPVIAPYPPSLASLGLTYCPPSPGHVLGCDGAGRDVLSRLLAATQISGAAALVAVVTSALIGVTSGLMAGYFQGWFDTVGAWFTALIMALPGMVVLLAARAITGPSVWFTMIIIGVLLTPAYYRLVLTSVSVVRSELFIDAARVAGLSDTRIIGRHVLSVVRAPIIIQTAIVASIALALQAGLDFLGLGDPSVPTWGGVLSEAFQAIYRAPLLMLWPSLALGLTTIALTLLANGMRDVLERTATVRRKRRPPISARTASIAATTTPVERTDATDNLVITTEDDKVIRHLDGRAQRTAEIILAVRDLHVGYSRRDGGVTEVLHGVSFTISRGEVHGLIGESGSGKSQTAFAVLGLLPAGGQITGGMIDFQGTKLESASERTLRGIRGRRIAYIPQEPMSNLDSSFTIGSQLVEPLRVTMGMNRKDATDKVLNILERVGIPQPLRTFKAYPFEISGGMAQRVLIAGAVSTDPDLIIADEPTTALDVTVQAEVLDLLRDLQQERHVAMLLVTHNFGVVADLCDQVTVMKSGLFVETGPVRSIFDDPRHPYTKSLLGAILDGGAARPRLAPVRSEVFR